MNNTSSNESYLPPVGWMDEEHPNPDGPGWSFLMGWTLVGLLLRLFMVDNQSLWVDEIMTWEMVRPHAGLHFWQQTLDSIQGPLFQAVLWPLLRWQDTGLMLRLPAVLAGVLSIPVFGIIAGKLFGSKTARLATILWVINPFHVWYSQEARGYSFLILFVLMAAFFFLKMKQNGPTFRQSILFGLACAAAVWSNMSGLFFWAAMGSTWILQSGGDHKKQRLLWFFAFGLGLVSVAPWILKAMGIWAVGRVVPGAETGVDLRGSTTFSIIALPYTLFSFFYGFSWGPSLRELHSPDRLHFIKTSLPVLLLGAIPMGIGLVNGLLRAHGRRLLLLLWILLPVLVLMLLAMRNVKPWNARYVMIVLPWLVMMAAHGLSHLPRKTGLALGIIMGALSLFSLGNNYFNSAYHKADLRSAAFWVQENNHSENPIVVPVVSTVFNYYYSGSGKVIETFGRSPITSSVDAELFVREVLSRDEEIWVILAREWFFDPGDRVLVALARSGHLHLVHEEPGVRIFKWQSQHFEGKARGDR